MMVVMVRDGRITEAATSTPTPTAVVLVLVLLGDGQRHLVADSLLHQERSAARLL
jgi:hypothetical protein